MKTKICQKCGKEKEVNEYHKRSSACDGYDYWCKTCRARWACKYHKKNAKRIIERTRKWQKENPNKVNANSRLYYKKHSEKVKKRYRIYNKTHRNQLAERLRVWRALNPEKIKETNKRTNGKRKNFIYYDSYIIQLLCQSSSVSPLDISQILIETKREHLKLLRLIRGNKNENNERSKRKVS